MAWQIELIGWQKLVLENGLSEYIRNNANADHLDSLKHLQNVLRDADKVILTYKA